jgi:arylsulfatase A-like enzyme
MLGALALALALVSTAEPSVGPNVLMILVDDLGYGDLSVSPFTGHGLLTPNLEAMSKRSTVLTNFHVVAPVCTPSRAALLTGLFPWRLGIYSIYGTGPQALEYMTVVPTSPMAFLQQGYHTAHVGKWHLGGMQPKDIALRQSQNCTPGLVEPGPMQHGFVEYVAMAEGPESPRLKILSPTSTLYHAGAQHLLRNEKPWGQSQSPKKQQILTDRQTDEAIRIMNETVSRGQRFYLHLWYDAPHGPWEIIEPYDRLYKETAWPGGRASRNFKYATMVSSVDANIGRVRSAIEALSIAEDTLLVFLSDNGPEERAGGTAGFKGRKRSLQEGGIRVPCMFEWRGRIAENVRLDNLVLSTDLFPTFLAAAGVTKPKQYRLDGTSVLDLLLLPSPSPSSSSSSSSHHLPIVANSSAKARVAQLLTQRVALWHKDIEGKASVAWSRGYKLLVHGEPVNKGAGTRSDKLLGRVEMYDMLADEREYRPLLGLPMVPVGAAGGPGPAATSASRSDPHIVGRVRAELYDQLAQFVEQANRPYAARKAAEAKADAPTNSSCAAPLASDASCLPWDAQTAALPIF